jgi:hypothetical protein
MSYLIQASVDIAVLLVIVMVLWAAAVAYVACTQHKHPHLDVDRR